MCKRYYNNVWSTRVVSNIKIINPWTSFLDGPVFNGQQLINQLQYKSFVRLFTVYQSHVDLSFPVSQINIIPG